MDVELVEVEVLEENEADRVKREADLDPRLTY